MADRSRVSARSTSMVRAGIESSATGARLGMVTWKVWLAVRPPGSVAVTVTVALPLARAASVTVVPCAEAVSRVESEEAAA